VTAEKHHVKQLVNLALTQVALVFDHEQCSNKHYQAVANIAKHDGKQERERNDGRKTSINFPVLARPVSVNYSLETQSKLVDLVVGRRGLCRSQLCQNGL